MKFVLFVILFLQCFLLVADNRHLIVDSYYWENLGNYEKAIEVMTKLDNSYPNDHFYKLRLGWLYLNMGNYSSAETHYTESLKLKETFEAKEGLINTLFYLGKWSGAIDIGKQIIKISPDNFNALTKIAYSYYAVKDYANAAKYYQSASDIYSYNLEVLGYLLDSYHNSGNLIKAQEIFSKLYLYSPQNPFILLHSDKYNK